PDLEICTVVYGSGDSVEGDGQIRNVGVITTPGRMAELLKCCDLYATMTKEDNLPNTILEALACGVPVVATNVGGIPEMIKDGENGRLVPRDDSRAMADVLYSIVTNREELLKWAKAARRTAENLFDPADQSEEHERVYRSLL